MQDVLLFFTKKPRAYCRPYLYGSGSSPPCLQHLSPKFLPQPHPWRHHLAALATRPHTAARGPWKLTNGHVSHLKQPLDDGLLTAESPKAPLTAPLAHAAQPWLCSALLLRAMHTPCSRGPGCPELFLSYLLGCFPHHLHVLFHSCLLNEKCGYLLKFGGPPTAARSIPQAHLLCPTDILISHSSTSLASASHCLRFVCLPPQEWHPLAAEIQPGIFTN